MRERGWADTWAPLPRGITPKGHQPTAIHIQDYQLTEEDLIQFHIKGYWVGPQLVSDEDVRVLRMELERVMKGEVDNSASPYEYQYWQKVVTKHNSNSPDVRKINNAWWVNQTMRSVVTSSAIGRIAARLLNTPEVRLWHDQAIWKPGLAGHGEGVDENAGNIGWHQDYGFWQISNTSNMCTAWIALQDTDETNGCLRTITGSQKWGLLPDSAAFFDKNLAKLQDRFSGVSKEWEDEPCHMKAGQIAFHHALTFHGSGPNLTPHPRLAIAVHMMPADCGYQPGFGWHHNLEDLGPNVKPGDLFVGECFPVLYKEGK